MGTPLGYGNTSRVWETPTVLGMGDTYRTGYTPPTVLGILHLPYWV